MRRTSALIAGGGPAGAVAAILLARAGQTPLIIERTAEPQDALCGGFLSWRTLDALDSIGVDRSMLGGHRIGQVALYAGHRRSVARLPRQAIGVSRLRLDALLLDRARAAGARIERGVAIRAAEGRRLRTGDGTYLTADALFLATGKHDLRGLARPVPTAADPAMGIRVRLNAAPGLTMLVADAIELHLFDRGYAGIELQEDGSANLCMAVRRSRLDDAGDLPTLLTILGTESPHLGDRLRFMTPDATIDAIANVPYGWRTADTVSGIFRLGDQAGVIPSLAGEGMGIAIASGIQAARRLMRDGPSGAVAYQHRFAGTLRWPLATAGVVRMLAERPGGARLLVAGAKMPMLVDMVADLTRIARPHD